MIEVIYYMAAPSLISFLSPFGTLGEIIVSVSGPMGQIEHAASEPPTFGCASIFHVRPCIHKVGRCWKNGTSSSPAHCCSQDLLV